VNSYRSWKFYPGALQSPDSANNAVRCDLSSVILFFSDSELHTLFQVHSMFWPRSGCYTLVVNHLCLTVERARDSYLLTGKGLDAILILQSINVFSGAENPFSASPDAFPCAGRCIRADRLLRDHLFMGVAERVNIHGTLGV
jgi:hypothetical protein